MMAADPLRYFRIEARELIDQLGKAALDLEKGPAAGLVAQLLRLAHTLKGAARVVKQREIADHAHALEEVLAPFRDSAAPLPGDHVDSILGLLDRIGERVAALVAPAEPIENPVSQAQPEPPPVALHIDMREMHALLDGIGETHAQLAPLRTCLATITQAARLVGQLGDPTGASRVAREALASTLAASERTRSLTDELRRLLASATRDLTTGVEQLDRELRQVLDTAEHLRLVPARTIFTALERTARDAAQALGKRVVFSGRGGDVRLDPYVLGVVQSALLQVVRNAVAHGIESPSARAAAGKAAGQVAITVVRQGRRVVFTGSDDGQGVDLEAVRAVLQRRGLLSAEAQRLGPEELLRLLLKGGISTAGTVTEVSGRGVGLDVVREAVERLGGTLEVRSEAGKGTTVELSVPLALASIEVLMVEAAGIPVAIPREAVRQSVRIAVDAITRGHDGASVVHQGRALPFMALSQALSGRRAAAHGQHPWSALVVQVGDAGAVFGVDRLLGMAQVVVQPLPELAPASAVVAGASLDVAGNPQLVLDPGALVAAAGVSQSSLREDQKAPVQLLVIDDSLTTRMLEQSILSSAGYAVDVATSGEEGMEMVQRRRYALILVDVEMPGMDGFTFIERLRRDPAQAHIPTMLVTSRASAEDFRRGEQVGACAYIVKSRFDQNEVLDRIRKLVG
jgi:two-component system chemotaxis sensor kinase CheA